MRPSFTRPAFILLCAIGAGAPAPLMATLGDTCAAATFELGSLPEGRIDTTEGRDDTNSYGGPCADGSDGVAGSGTGADVYYRIRPSGSCTLRVSMNPVGTSPLKNLGLYIASNCAPLSAVNCITMDDNGGGGVTEIVEFPATAGTDYYILVDGTDSDEDIFSMVISSATGDCGSLVGGNGDFHTLPPCRVVDTRGGDPAPPIGGPALTHGDERTLALAGKCLIPAAARAVSLNITAIGPTGPGSLVLYPVAGAPTNTTAISFNANGTRANNGVFGLNAAGELQVMPSVSNPNGADEVHLIVDVNGYFD